MQLGGNANASQFFRQHNCNTTDAQLKYNSRTAQLYRDKLQNAAQQAMKIHGTVLHLDSLVENVNNNDNNNKEEDDFFADCVTKTTSSDINQFNSTTINNYAANVVPEAKFEEKLSNPTLNDIGGSPSVDFLNSDVSADPPTKSTIGVRKIQPKKSGMGGKKGGGGLGASKVKTNFADIEQRANLSDQQKLKVIDKKLTVEEEAETIASVRLAYQDLSMKAQKEEAKLKNIDPTKAKQMERLGMGFNRTGDVSHSALNDMHTIAQQPSSKTIPSSSSSSSKNVDQLCAVSKQDLLEDYLIMYGGNSNNNNSSKDDRELNLLGYETIEPMELMQPNITTMFSPSTTTYNYNNNNNNNTNIGNSINIEMSEQNNKIENKIIDENSSIIKENCRIIADDTETEMQVDAGDDIVKDKEDKDNETEDNDNKINDKEVIETKENDDKVVEAEDNDDDDDVDDVVDVDDDDKDKEEDIDDVRDREINKLLDFSTLTVKHKESGDSKEMAKRRDCKFTKKFKKNVELIDEDITENTECNESNTESEEEIISEEQFLKQCNLNAKEKISQFTSGSSNNSTNCNSDESELDLYNSSGEDDKINKDHKSDGEDSNDSIFQKFLDDKIIDVIQKSFEEKEVKTVAVDNVTDGAASDEKNINNNMASANEFSINNKVVEIDSKINTDCTDQDSSINNKNIDDEDKDASNKNKNEVTVTKNTKTTENEYKKDKFDKIIMSKNLFSDLDSSKDDPDNELMLNNNKFDKVSNDSDCEILDTSMFKTNSRLLSDEEITKALRAVKNQVTASTSATTASTTTAASMTGTTTTKATSTVVTTVSSSTNTGGKLVDDCISLSSDSDIEIDEIIAAVEVDSAIESSRRGPRRMLRTDQLTGETKLAQREEADRIKRLDKKNERLTQVLSQSQQIIDETVEINLDYDSKREEFINVHSEIIKHLKQHQIDGVKFMYDCCYGNIDTIKKFPGSGCILAHCMGLGKTLQLIVLLHTVIRYPQLETNKVLVICPKSTVMNWADELSRWLGPIRAGPKLKVYHFPDSSTITDKLQILQSWHNSGKDGFPQGCLLIGYEAFRSLVFYNASKKHVSATPTVKLDKIQKKIDETLLKPGADLVICDEGHMIKNRKSSTSLAVNKIETKRRIILTGTPIQNNLKEYFSLKDAQLAGPPGEVDDY